MFVDFVRPLRSYDGSPLIDSDPKMKGAPILLRQVCCNALTALIQGEVLTGEEKLHRWKLAERIHKEARLDLKVEEIALLKKLIDQVYPILVVAPSWELLENNAAPVEH